MSGKFHVMCHVNSEGPDQPAQSDQDLCSSTYSLISSDSVSGNEHRDQTARMPAYGKRAFVLQS